MVEKYFRDLKDIIDDIDITKIENAINIIYNAYKSDKHIFIMGNGGSAATASHFACDLGKGTVVDNKPRLKVISLNDNIALITALSNDLGYDKIFKEQLKNLMDDGDVVIAISCSGNSSNVVCALEYAIERGAYIISFTGFDGGILKQKSNLNIHINSCNYGQIEDMHLSIEHCISQSVYRILLNNE